MRSPIMPSTSPNPSLGAPTAQQQQQLQVVTSPHTRQGSTSKQAGRPTAPKRHSSASSGGRRGDALSPGSHDGHQHPLAHRAKPAGRHARVVLPRNHSSGRNLARLAQQVQVQQDKAAKRSAHRKSHEGDTEIRLPGSLDEPQYAPPPPAAPAMKRNLTAYQLPRNQSNSKLKKNLSHGQLNKINSGKNLKAMATAMASTTQRSPGSPNLKGRTKRPKSAEMTAEKDLHEQEVEIMEQQQAAKEGPKKVGFALGSAGDSSDEDAPDMEGSGLQEDEWTEDSNSASASPYSTRDNTANNTRENTANNSRRPSVVQDKPPDNKVVFSRQTWQGRQKDQNRHRAMENAHRDRAKADADAVQKKRDEDDEQYDEENGTDDTEEVSDSEGPSPGTSPIVAPKPNVEDSTKAEKQVQLPPPAQAEAAPQLPEDIPQASQEPEPQLESQVAPQQAKTSSALATAKNHTTPTIKLLDQRTQVPAPALVSNISALDDVHSARESPADSGESSRISLTAEGSAEQDQEELVSRFLPSASHPSFGSGHNTAFSTPKQSSFHTPEEDSTLAAQNRSRVGHSFQAGPTSPVSTVSGSSGAATPAGHRSRIDMKMALEKHQAKMESEAERQPLIPVHVYDRRNESLKSWLNLAHLHAAGGDGRASLSAPTTRTLGPELFQGRFKAVNQELKVVQKYQDPIRDTVTRLRQCKGSKLSEPARTSTNTSANLQKPPGQHQAAALRLSKSAVSLPAARKGSHLSTTSTSPPPGTGKSASPAKAGLAASAALGAANEEQQKRGSQSMRGNNVAKRAVSFKDAGPDPASLEGSAGGDRERAGSMVVASTATTSANTSSPSTSSSLDIADIIARQMWASIGARAPQ